jgi:serine/threonine-protein kinase
MLAKSPAISPSAAPSVRGGPYALAEEIGVGGAARVFTAVDTNAPFGRTLAVKTLRPALASKPHYVRSLLREARLLSSLAHPNVVQVLDYGFQRGDALMVMEYVQGVSLGRLMRLAATQRLSVPEPIVLYIALEVLGALDYVHQPHEEGERGVVHRDVSPGNVLVDTRGTVKLIDFGIAQSASSPLLAPGTICGKPGYLSPEQARGELVDQRSDLFSLAVILAELVLASRLFSGRTPEEIIEDVLSGDLSPLERMGHRIPADLACVLTVALAADPADRFQTAGEFESALLDFVARQGWTLPTARGVGSWLTTLGIAPLASGTHPIPDDPTSPDPPPTWTEAPTTTWGSRP